MILTVQYDLHRAITAALQSRFALTDVPAFGVEVPPNRALGDLSVTVAFQLARQLRKPPRAIASELAAALGTVPGIERVDVASNGYLNFFLDRRAYLLPRFRGDAAPLRHDHQKTIVEHTAINPNKAAHVGHLRNAALGDTLVR
ncbi:MAG: arginine--tRNA ligase, partial [Vicinamibacterales bacterium]